MGFALLRARADDEGAVAVLIAVIFSVVAFMLAALVVDVGVLEGGRRQMQTAADAAALAGARELIPLDGAATTRAREMAIKYAVANGAEAGKVTVAFQGSPALTITVSVGADTDLAFAQSVGKTRDTVGGAAAAAIGCPTGYATGVMPFGIMSADPSGTAGAFGYSLGQTVTLKQAAGSGETGNYQFLDLVGSVDQQGGGAQDIYRPLAAGGVQEPVYVGETYYTQRGINGTQVQNNLATLAGADRCSFDSVVELTDEGVAEIKDWDCTRLILCPIIVGQDTRTGEWNIFNWADDNIARVKILGFSWFFLENYGTSGNKSWVVGRFIRPLQPEDPTGWGAFNPWGAVGFRLTN